MASSRYRQDALSPASRFAHILYNFQRPSVGQLLKNLTTPADLRNQPVLTVFQEERHRFIPWTMTVFTSLIMISGLAFVGLSGPWLLASSLMTFGILSAPVFRHTVSDFVAAHNINFRARAAGKDARISPLQRRQLTAWTISNMALFMGALSSASLIMSYRLQSADTISMIGLHAALLVLPLSLPVFGISALFHTLQRFIAEMPAALPDQRNKAFILDVFERNEWNFGKVREELGLTSRQSLDSLIIDADIMPEFKNRLIQRLIERKGVISFVANDFGTTMGTVTRIMGQLGISAPQNSKEDIREILRQNDWNLKKSAKAIGFKPSNSFTDFFRENGLETEFIEVIKKSLEQNGWVLDNAAPQLGVTPRTLRALVEHYGLEEPKEDKEKILSILARVNWNFKDARSELELKSKENYFDFITTHGILDEFELQFRKRALAAQDSRKVLAREFGVSPRVIGEWMRQLGAEHFITTTKAQALDVLEKQQWNIPAASALLPLRRKEPFLQFAQRTGLTEELKKELLHTLAQANWAISATADHFHVTPKVINGWILSLELRKDDKTPDEIRAILNANQWNLAVSRKTLGIIQGESYSTFFKNAGAEELIREKCLSLLKFRGPNIAAIGRDLGLDSGPAANLLDELAIEVPEPTPEQILQLLRDTNWDLNQTAKAISGHAAPSYADLYNREGVRRPLYDHIQERLAAHAGAPALVAAELGTSLHALNRLIATLESHLANKAEILFTSTNNPGVRVSVTRSGLSTYYSAKYARYISEAVHNALAKCLTSTGELYPSLNVKGHQVIFYPDLYKSWSVNEQDIPYLAQWTFDLDQPVIGPLDDMTADEIQVDGKDLMAFLPSAGARDVAKNLRDILPRGVADSQRFTIGSGENAITLRPRAQKGWVLPKSDVAKLPIIFPDTKQRIHRLVENEFALQRTALTPYIPSVAMNQAVATLEQLLGNPPDREETRTLDARGELLSYFTAKVGNWTYWAIAADTITAWVQYLAYVGHFFLQIQDDEVAVSVNGFKKYLNVSDAMRLTKVLQDVLGTVLPEEVEKSLAPGEAPIRFTGRLTVGNSIWVFKKKDLEQLARIYGAPLRKEGEPPRRPRSPYDKAVQLFQKYHVLDIAINLSAYPDEMQQALTILLTGQGATIEPEELTNLTRAFLTERGLGPGGGQQPGPKPNDDLDYLRGLMRIQAMFGELDENEQLVLMRAFIRLSFPRFARNYKEAMEQMRATLSESPSTEFLKKLTKYVEFVFGQGLAFQPSHILTPLKPHQRVGAWLMRNSYDARAYGVHGFLLEDDTRLGKTIQTYAAIEQDWRSIIVVPAGVMDTWEEQYIQHTDRSSRFVVVRGSPHEKRAILASVQGQKNVILLISIEDMRSYTPDEIEQMNENMDVVVIDEAQRMENYGGQHLRTSSQQARALHRLKAPRKWLLSATPYTSSERQLFSALNYIHRDPMTNEVSDPMFLNRRAFNKFLTGTVQARKWLYAIKARIGLRRTKTELGILYGKKREVPISEEGAYAVSMEQARLELRIIKNLGDYVKIYNRRVPPDERIPERSLSMMLKMQFLSWALTDPTMLGENIPTTYWDAMDNIVLKRLEQRKKGIILAQNTAIIDKAVQRYQNLGYKVARIDGTITGYATDAQGRLIRVRFTPEGRMVEDPQGSPISAQAYQRHLLQEDPDVCLIVINIRAGVGLNLSRADWELYAQLPDNYVQYYQSSDRAIGLNEGPEQKIVEALFMVPKYPQEMLTAAQGTPDAAYLEHGTPAEILLAGMMSEDRSRFDTVMEGLSTDRGITEQKALTRLVHAVYGFLQDPSMARRKTKPGKELESAGALYPVYRRFRKHKGFEEAVLRLVQNFMNADLSPLDLSRSLMNHEKLDGADLDFVNAVFELPNKFQRDRTLQFLPSLLNHIWTRHESITELSQRGPPALGMLAETEPALFLPFIAASHAWKTQEDVENVLQPEHPGSQVLVQLLEEFFADGFSDYDRSLWLRRWISALVPLSDLGTDNVLNLMADLQGELLDEGISLEARIRFFEELALLRQTNIAAFNQIVTQHQSFAVCQQAVRHSLQDMFVDLFDLPRTEQTHQQILNLARHWGSLQAPIQLMAKLHSGHARDFQGHIALFKIIMRNILDGTYKTWRNEQQGSATDFGIAYRQRDRAFWQIFTREEEVDLGAIAVQPKELQRVQAKKMENLLNRLSDARALRDAFGLERANQIGKDFKDPDHAKDSLKDDLAIKGKQRGLLEKMDQIPALQSAIATIDGQLGELRLRLAILTIRESLLIQDVAPLPRALKRVIGAIRKTDIAIEAEPILVEDIRDLLKSLEMDLKVNKFADVTVQITSDPDLIMRRGMLAEDLKNCFNLTANVNQIATLVDDLASRNKMLAVVRSGGSIVSVAMLKVRRTLDGKPVLMIERPLERRGYGFEKEIAQALEMTKLHEMSDTAIAMDLRSGHVGETVDLYSTGARGPTEYHEALFGWRRRNQEVRHKAVIVVKPDTDQKPENLANEGVTRVPITLEGVSHEVIGVGHSNRSLADFLTLLKRAGIRTIVDVRTNPISQYNPHFNRKALEEALRRNNITYRWEGELLGGKLPEYNGDFQKYMQEDSHGRFTTGINRLLAIIRSDANPIGILCSEKALENCHRQYILNYLNTHYGSSTPSMAPNEPPAQGSLFEETPSKKRQNLQLSEAA